MAQLQYPYPNPAASLINSLAAVGGDGDNTKPKKSALYRAGAAVGTAGRAARQVATTVDTAADQAINSGVDAAKLGATNFIRGVQGQPALDALLPTPPPSPAAPATTPAATPAAAQTGAPALARPAPIFGASVDQMRANGAVPATAPAAPLLQPTVDSGVTLPDGRKLAYGATVNGVPTFSDGTGTGGIPRTMTDADIKGLGARLNTVPASAFTAPAPTFNSDNTEANVQSTLRSRQGGKFGITPEQNAAADLAAVTNQDPRSTLGLAAMNAARSASAAPTVMQRKAALSGLSALQQAVGRNAAESIADPAALARVNAEGQSALQRQGLANQGDLARQTLANQGELDRTNAAGGYQLASSLVRPGASGAMTDKDYITEINKGVAEQIKAYNDQQALLPAAQRQPLTDQMIAEMRSVYAKGMGRSDLAPATNTAPSYDQFVQAVRQRGSKMSDAELKAYYQKNYGG